MGFAGKMGGGGSTLARSDDLGQLLGKILLDIFRDEVPQMSARLSAGQGVQKLFGQFPNAQVMKLEGASLRVLVCVRML